MGWYLIQRLVLLEYRNDHMIVPRSTTVIAQRLPAKKPHRGTAQNYVVETVASTPTPALQEPQQRAEYKGRVMSMRFDQPSASNVSPLHALLPSRHVFNSL